MVAAALPSFLVGGGAKDLSFRHLAALRNAVLPRLPVPPGLSTLRSYCGVPSSTELRGSVPTQTKLGVQNMGNIGKMSPTNCTLVEGWLGKREGKLTACCVHHLLIPVSLIRTVTCAMYYSGTTLRM